MLAFISFFSTTDNIGRYYVILRNIDGTNGNIYIDFHGDLQSSSGEHHLSKSENYPDHPFGSKHTVSAGSLVTFKIVQSF